jgi:hypothetical protein
MKKRAQESDPKRFRMRASVFHLHFFRAGDEQMDNLKE